MVAKNPKFRVAIFGAGVIGLYLAWRLTLNGQKVTVFEKKDKIGGKACSSLISERIKNFILVDQSLIENKINSLLIHFPKKTIILKLKPGHLVINRQKLSQFLFNLAKKSGAEILFSQKIKEIPKNFDKIIGCDGALSKIREFLLLPKPSFRLGLQFFLKTKNSSDFVETWPINNGFFWKIPRGFQVEYGAIGSLNSIREEFEKFCQSQNLNFDKKELKSALIPQGLILPKNENITLCGDALGLTKPWSGGGIIWGLTAADILVKNFPNFQRYHREVRRFFGPQIFLGKLANSLVHFFGDKVPFLLPKKITYDNDFLKLLK